MTEDDKQVQLLIIEILEIRARMQGFERVKDSCDKAIDELGRIHDSAMEIIKPIDTDRLQAIHESVPVSELYCWVRLFDGELRERVMALNHKEM